MFIGPRPRSVARTGSLRFEGHLLVCVIVALAGWAAAWPVALRAQAKAQEYEVKAAYLYNFGRFVEWPTAARGATDSAFHICVIGQDPFGAALDSAVASVTLDERRVVIRRITTPADAEACRILFVSSSADSQLNEIFKTIGNAPVLTVGESPQFLRRGGMIQFVFAGNRVRFEVNLAPAEAAGLTLSSQLLKVASAIRTPPKPGH